MDTTTHTPITAKQTARALARAAVLLTAYFIQSAVTSSRAAYRLARMVWHWLNDRHDFARCRENPVIMTGWQYIGLSLITAAILIILSIDIH